MKKKMTILNKSHKSITIFTLLCVSLFLSTPFATSQEVEDETEFSYTPGAENGPENWGHIHSNWSACGEGQAQSPIDLLHERVQVMPHLGKLLRSYRPSHAILKNRGHDIELKFEGDAGSIWINETRYDLKQLHWHSPSEHTINGKRYSLEIHMVHMSTDNKIAVVGILYKYGRPDNFIAELEPYIVKISNIHEAEEEVGVIDPRDVKRGSRKYYRYMGSLTTPPCTEGVVWTIVKKVRTVSREQVKLLKEAVHDGSNGNARPLQKIYDRIIGLYRPQKIQY